MSKFQVGDEVLVDGYAGEWEVASIITQGLPEGCSAHCRVTRGDETLWVPVYALSAVSPSVPDCDGNPIRVGQLVERVVDECETGKLAWVIHTGADDPAFPDNRIFYRCPDGRTVWEPSTQWRVVTDTFRQPEPPTRDVVLKVTLWGRPPHDDPAEYARDVASALSGELAVFESFAVEVVDD